MKQVLITGGAGSIGRELAENLIKKGYKITVFDIPQANYKDLAEQGIDTYVGDIANADDVMEAVKGKDFVIHLAGILPPHSEFNETKTFAVNTEGTKNLVDAIVADGKKAQLVFSSSVSVYGDTTSGQPFISAMSPEAPNSVYSRSKYEAEKYMLESGIIYTNLRVSAVFMAALIDPPQWPCVSGQRVEFVYRGDVVAAILGAIDNSAAYNKTLIVSGGPSWQMQSDEFVERFLEVLGVDMEDNEYPEKPLYSDWYDTEESQRILNFQNTSFEEYLNLLEKAIEEAIN